MRHYALLGEVRVGIGCHESLQAGRILRTPDIVGRSGADKALGPLQRREPRLLALDPVYRPGQIQTCQLLRPMTSPSFQQLEQR